MERVHKFTLDISKGIKNTSIEVVTQDYASHKFDITLVEDEYKPFNLEDTIVRLIVLKPDGHTVQQDCTIVDNQGKVSVLLQLDTINIAGTCKAEIQVWDNAVANKRLTSAQFGFKVRKSLQDEETVVSTDEFSMLQTALEQAQNIDEKIAGKADQEDVTLLNDRLNGMEANLNEAQTVTIGPTTDSIIPMPDTAKGQISDIVLKGNTRTNLYNYNQIANNNVNCTINADGDLEIANVKYFINSQGQIPISPSQKITIGGNIKANQNGTIAVYFSNDSNKELLSIHQVGVTAGQWYNVAKKVVNIPIDAKYFKIVGYFNENSATITVNNFYVFDGDRSNEETHFITGTKSTLCSFRMQSKKSDGTVGSEAYVYKEYENGNIIEINKLVNPTTGEVVVEDEVNNGTLYKKTWTVLNVSSGTVINYADMATGGQFEAWGANGEHVVGVKGDTLAFAATKVIYQLAVSKKYENVVIGSATAYPEGSVYFEYGHYEEQNGQKVWIPAEAGSYTNGEVTLTVATNVAGELQSLNKAVSQQGDTLIAHEIALLTLSLQALN